MRRGFLVLIFLAFLVGFSPTPDARGDLIAYWNFNGLVNNTNNGIFYAPDQGAGLIVLDGWTSEGISAKMGTTINALGGDPAGQALGLERSENNGASMVFSFNMAGYFDPILSFAHRTNDFGFDSVQASWSTDGVTFTDFGAAFTPTLGTFGFQSLDFSSIDALDNELTAFIKLTFDGAIEGFGKFRIDNPQINASTVVIPEPSIALAGGVLVLLLLGCRLRNPRRQRVDFD
jgi:hypothetical protein